MVTYQVTWRHNSEIKYRNFHCPDSFQVIQVLCDVVLCQGKVVPDVSKNSSAFFQGEAVQRRGLLEIKLKAQRSFETSDTANPATKSSNPEQLNIHPQVLNKLERSRAGCLVVHFKLRQRQ